ncbi:MAG TPA: nuclear transport factor 2 family protein [Acidocella sp.]|jgi:ketosteroid isomerase-like protein|uniref:nuclear transport factor 2 family protein n=1 Tax=Acidocella sp. TaxID=50710 RepID=UPI002BBDCE66|nr:nuclear transport factor 2 family protein [Acidocella sp.]HVE21399.1 nuclear transport factor 2 family protein [Acidocella sp.]
MEKDRVSLLETLFAAFNRHDADGVMACFAPDIVFDAATGPEALGKRITGQDDVRAAFVGTWTSMPDVQWHVRRHAVFGDRAVTEWLFTATAPQGGRIEVEGLDLFGFEGALIVSKSAFRKDRPLQPVA